MSDEEINGVYDEIRMYYSNFYASRANFLRVYRQEFKSFSTEVMLEAFKLYRRVDRRDQPPSITDMKDKLLRLKWILEYRLEDTSLNPKLRQKYQTAYDELSEGLGEFGKEYE